MRGRLCKLPVTRLAQALTMPGVVAGMEGEGDKAHVTLAWSFSTSFSLTMSSFLLEAPRDLVSFRVFLFLWQAVAVAGQPTPESHVCLRRPDSTHRIGVEYVGVLLKCAGNVEICFQCFQWRGRLSDVETSSAALLLCAEVRVRVEYCLSGSMCGQQMGLARRLC